MAETKYFFKALSQFGFNNRAPNLTRMSVHYCRNDKIVLHTEIIRGMGCLTGLNQSVVKLSPISQESFTNYAVRTLGEMRVFRKTRGWISHELNW